MNLINATPEQKTRFGQELFFHRKQMRLSQAKFAKKLGVARCTVNEWENGKNFPSAKFVFLLSKLLGLDVLTWLGPEQPPPAAPGRRVIKEIIIEVKKPTIPNLIPGSRIQGDDYEFAS